MYENNYSYNPEENQQNSTDDINTIPVNAAPETPAPKKKGASGAVKAILAVCCMAAVSVGSIAGYKYIDENGNPFAAKESPAVSENRKLPVEEDDDKGNEELPKDNLTSESLINVQQGGEVLSTQAIYRKVLPSVVGVTSVFEYQTQGYGGMWGFSSGSSTEEVSGTGTGIIMSSDGYILTNAHVIADDDYGVSTKVTIRLYDETEIDAEIVGYDRQTDLAVLKADAEDLTPAEFGSSENLKVGDPALAIGNPLGFDLFGTLTAGYVSGLNREISVNDTTMKLIQTDAAINNGNSGGPLINQYGQVIGINSMKLSSTYSSSSATIEGLGFAIPVDDAKKIVDDLSAHGYVTGRPQLGITYRDLSQSSSYYYSDNAGTSGVQVVGVNENGPADKAGIKAGDIIVGADGELVASGEDLKNAISNHDAGDKIHLTIVRNRNYYDVDVTLEERAADSN